MSDFRGYPQASPHAGTAMDMGLRAYMQRVYNYMAVGLGLTGIVAYAAYSAAVLPDGRTLTPFGQTLFHGPVMIVLMLLTLGLVFTMSMAMQRMSVATAQMVFWGYAALNGLTFSALGLAYTGSSIGRVFLITAATFGSASLYGYVTKRDLSSFGQYELFAQPIK